MLHNYYFLKPLSQAIAQKLQVNWQLGADEQEILLHRGSAMRLAVCFSQSKDELILGFCNENEEFYIRAVLAAEFVGLSFPENFARAKRNSANLFSQIIDLQVISVAQYLNERAFSLQFENDFTLVFKMHGRRANIILFEKDEFQIAFHKRMEADKELAINDLDRIIEQTEENFKQEKYDWKKLYPTFGKEINAYLEKQNIQSLSPENQWIILQKTLEKLENPHFYLLEPKENPQLSLLISPDFAAEFIEYSDAIEASNQFYYHFSRLNTLTQERNEIVKDLLKKLKQAQAYMEKNFARYAELEDASQNEQIGHLIMANLHQIPTGITQVELLDFYTNQNRIIKLKKELNPQKNAENYYRKAKNEKIERETLQKNLNRKEQEIKDLQIHLLLIKDFGNLKELRKYLKDNKLVKEQKSNKPDQHLFKKFEYQGFDIWIGKNAKNNDLLTQQYAYKEDLWLHAKDVSGSHVVIKYQAGKPFPKDVIAKAASLAAYYSKRSADSLCPVIFTPKKFVRKTKDLTDGQVIVEKEEVIMVVPEKF